MFVFIFVYFGVLVFVFGLVVGDVIFVFLEIDSDVSGVGGVQSGGFGDYGVNYWYIDLVGLELYEGFVGGYVIVDVQFCQWYIGVGVYSFKNFVSLEGG